MYLLQMVDPYNNQKMTFSEIVHLLSSHMVPVNLENPQQMIPLLEKFVNLTSDVQEHASEEMFQMQSEKNTDLRSET